MDESGTNQVFLWRRCTENSYGKCYIPLRAVIVANVTKRYILCNINHTKLKIQIPFKLLSYDLKINGIRNKILIEFVHYVELCITRYTLFHIYMYPRTLRVFLFCVVTYLITVTANIADCLHGSAVWCQVHTNTSTKEK
jgi:hypothetical protein